MLTVALRPDVADQLKTEAERFRAQHAELLTRYAGRHVAMRDGVVLDHDADVQALHARIRAQYGDAPIPPAPLPSTPATLKHSGASFTSLRFTCLMCKCATGNCPVSSSPAIQRPTKSSWSAMSSTSCPYCSMAYSNNPKWQKGVRCVV